MSAYINSRQENVAGVGEKPWVQLNRWGPPEYIITVTASGGDVTYDIEGTIEQLNRGETAIPFPVDDAQFTPITAQVLTSGNTDNFAIAAAPLEFIRLNQTAGTGSAIFRVMQSGASDWR